MEEEQDEGGTSAHSHSTQEMQALLGAGALNPEPALTVSAPRVSGPASVCSELGVVSAPAPLLWCSAPGTSVYPPVHRPHHTWVVRVLVSLTVSSAPVGWSWGCCPQGTDGWMSLWLCPADPASLPGLPGLPVRARPWSLFAGQPQGRVPAYHPGNLSVFSLPWISPEEGFRPKLVRARLTGGQGPPQTHWGVSEPPGGLGQFITRGPG